MNTATLATHLPPSVLRWIGRQQFRSGIGPVITHLARGLREQPVTISHGHAKGLRLNPAGANAGYALGTTEPAIQALLAEHVQAGDVIWDVGANIGFFTLLCARLAGPAGQIVAIDPLPANTRALRSNVKLNGLGNVEVVEIAASDHSGSDALHVFEESTWAKLDTVETTFQKGRGDQSITVALATLDSLLEGRAAPTFVKIDIEGAEVAALRGARRLLLETRPTLVVECHGTNRHVADLLESAEYDLTVVGSGLSLRDAPWDAHVLALPR